MFGYMQITIKVAGSRILSGETEGRDPAMLESLLEISKVIGGGIWENLIKFWESTPKT